MFKNNRHRLKSNQSKEQFIRAEIKRTLERTT